MLSGYGFPCSLPGSPSGSTCRRCLLRSRPQPYLVHVALAAAPSHLTPSLPSPASPLHLLPWATATISSTVTSPQFTFVRVLCFVAPTSQPRPCLHCVEKGSDRASHRVNSHLGLGLGCADLSAQATNHQRHHERKRKEADYEGRASPVTDSHGRILMPGVGVPGVHGRHASGYEDQL